MREVILEYLAEAYILSNPLFHVIMADYIQNSGIDASSTLNLSWEIFIKRQKICKCFDVSGEFKFNDRLKCAWIK